MKTKKNKQCCASESLVNTAPLSFELSGLSRILRPWELCKRANHVRGPLYIFLLFILWSSLCLSRPIFLRGVLITYDTQHHRTRCQSHRRLCVAALRRLPKRIATPVYLREQQTCTCVRCTYTYLVVVRQAPKVVAHNEHYHRAGWRRRNTVRGREKPL